MNLAGLILLSLGLGLAAWVFFMWTVKSGQYEDPEGAKYRMLEDDEGVPAPHRKPAERQPGVGDRAGDRGGDAPAERDGA